MTRLANRPAIMTLYSNGACSEGHCVRLVLAEKNVEYDHQIIDPSNTTEELQRLNPYNEIITLVDRDVVLYDTQIIMEYLEERYPHPPLMPADPVARANNRLFRYRMQRDLYGLVDALLNGGERRSAKARRQLRENLVAIAHVFAKKPYFMSEEYSLLDCYFIPLLWRLATFKIDLSRQPEPLQEYAQRMFQRESFKTSLNNLEREIPK
jgi:stringent starvation protein A